MSTRNGKYRGDKRVNHYAFEGIQYAAAPVGVLRFEPPRPVRPITTEILNATRQAEPCLQVVDDKILGTENCLFLNIYVTDVGKKAPVIVFFDGFAFMSGNANIYGPEYLLQRNLVVVTVNYRLGPFGFLSGETIHGNMGFKDQVQALKFINENIGSFGGDADQIVLAGWSAGAASVQLHYLSPLSAGLFARGISHGGSAMNNWVVQKDPEDKYKKMLQLTDCTSVECLKNLPAEKILQTISAFRPFNGYPLNPFGLVVEKERHGAFLTKKPREMIEKKYFQKLPWIVSTVQDDGFVFVSKLLKDPEILKDLNKHFNEALPHILHFSKKSASIQPSVAAMVRERYFQKEPVNEETFDRIVKISSDFLFHIGIQRSVEVT